MSIHGVQVTAQQAENSPITDEELERIFSSLESNMAIKSIDIAGDLEHGTIKFLLSVECPTGLDPESLVSGVVDDALTRALSEEGQSFRHDVPTLAMAFC